MKLGFLTISHSPPGCGRSETRPDDAEFALLGAELGVVGGVIGEQIIDPVA
ncbi:MAG TPA: hypothetical protein VM325_14630 [Alphaproteobacteria bacterium]|nr:hypothetical protein [Alphaproteobacteria bacterium]